MTIAQLSELGANTQEGLERCLDDEEFYLELIPEALQQQKYTDLEAKLKEKDLDGAFEVAHMLKGVLGNLALTPIYDVVSEITELLRGRTDTDYSGLLEKMWKERNKFEALL